VRHAAHFTRFAYALIAVEMYPHDGGIRTERKIERALQRALAPARFALCGISRVAAVVYDRNPLRP
jgi:hypothetical protein